MNYWKRLRLMDLILLIFLFLILSTSSVHAYLEPASGSYLLQLVIAGGVGVLFSAKVFWHQIKTFIYGIFLRKQKKDNSASKNKNGK